MVQRVVARFLERDLLEPHIEKITAMYRHKREVMISALKETMPPSIRWTEPEGGLFIWLTCPETYDTDVLFHEAAKAGVAYIPGSKFYPSGTEKRNEIRLNFSYATAEDLRTGVARLAKILSR